MPWAQHYVPLGGLFTSAAAAALPVVVLLALLAGWHVRAHRAALAGLLCALAVAIGIYGMPPALAVMAAVNGAAFGFFPIGWIVVNAIFIYDLSVATGQFAVLQEQVAGLARDRRLQALLIAYCFGAFIEGSAGFGAPVAITGALMVGLGFPPLEAAVLALIGNTAPVAFGSIGIPLVTLSSVTGLDLHLLSAMTGRQLPIFSALIPFWLVTVQAGWRGMLGVWPACLVTGATFRGGAICGEQFSRALAGGSRQLRFRRWRRCCCCCAFGNPRGRRRHRRGCERRAAIARGFRGCRSRSSCLRGASRR